MGQQMVGHACGELQLRQVMRCMGDGHDRRRSGDYLLYGRSNGSEVGIDWENYLDLIARRFYPQLPEVLCQYGIQRAPGKIPPLDHSRWAPDQGGRPLLHPGMICTSLLQLGLGALREIDR